MTRIGRCLVGCALAVWVASGHASPQAAAGESRQVEVDGHLMHLSIAGAGAPTVVLEAGSGFSLDEWRDVQPAIAGFARVVSYDRPGLGSSATCAKPDTGERIATELHEALAAAHLPPPYVLVAHSMGGPYARIFASRFPRDVVGLVLADPAPEHFYERVRKEQPELAAIVEQSKDAPAGAARVAIDTTLAQAAASDPLSAMPIVVLSRGAWGDAPPQLSSIWTGEQRQWTAQQPHGTFRIVEGSGHVIPRDRPQAVVQAVREVIQQAATMKGTAR